MVAVQRPRNICAVIRQRKQLYIEPILESSYVEAVRMFCGRLLHAVGLPTLNAWLPRRRLVRGTSRSQRAAKHA